MTLDALAKGTQARIVAVDWDAIPPADAKRLRALGIDTGAQLSIAHRGVLGGGDPLAVSIGRATVALRRSHACAIRVDDSGADHDGR